MTSREKVINGLECIISSGNAGMRDDCANCVYPGGGDCIAPALRDALTLLKAYEPRVMTLEELGKLQEDDVVYVEIKPVRDITCISVEFVRFVEEVQDLQDPAIWIELHTTDSAGFFETRKSTEPNWRCWTAKPSLKQMEEIPWN